MFKVLLYLCLVVVCNDSMGQYAGKGVKEIKKILAQNDTVMVLLTGDNKFDEALVYSLVNYWKIGNWDTITLKKWKEINQFDSKQLLLIVNVQLLRESSVMLNSSGRSTQMYQNAKFQMEYALVQKKDALKAFDISADPLVYDVVNFKGNEKNYLNMAYRLPLTIYNIQNVLKLITIHHVKKPIIENFSTINNKLEEYYLENAGILKDKILLLNSDESELIDEDDFKNYPYKYEFANSERIATLIKEKNPNYAFLHLACHSHKYITIYDLETYVPLYGYCNINPVKCKLKPNISEIIDVIKSSDATVIKHNYLMESVELNSQD